MTPDEYAGRQAVIAAATAVFVQKVAQWFTAPLLGPAEWLNLLQFLFPFVEQKRRESAELARTFYDFQRAEVHPELPRHDVLLEASSFEFFVRDMEPVRLGMQAQESSPGAVTRLTMQAVRDVENAGRRQIIRSVESDKPVAKKVAASREKLKFDPETKQDLLDLLAGGANVDRPTWGGQTLTEKQTSIQRYRTDLVQGWARVATGRETCSWCLMLISRGPKYVGAEKAGVYDYLQDDEVAAMYKADPEGFLTDIEPHMDEWHTGCDCKVVPVFDKADWVGETAAKKARGYWKDATKKARAELRENPDKQYYSRKDEEWQDTDLNRETINQLRKMIENGEITTDWAAISLDSPPLAA